MGVINRVVTSGVCAVLVCVMVFGTINSTWILLSMAGFSRR